MDIRKLQRAIVDGLEDVKAQNIVVFNTEHLSPLFERVIIASGTSNRQTKALASSVRDAVKGRGLPAPRTEGEDNGEWIIVDCGAAVVHVMQPAIRDYYHLEEIWGDKPVKLKLDGTPTRLVKASAPAPAKTHRRSRAGEEPPAKKAPAKKAPAKRGPRQDRLPSKKAPARKAPARKPVTRTVGVKKTAVGEEDHRGEEGPAQGVKLLLVAVGQRQPAWAETAYEDYAKRFPPELRLELKAVKAETRGSKTAEQLMAAEAGRIDAALPKGARRIVLRRTRRTRRHGAARAAPAVLAARRPRRRAAGRRARRARCDAEGERGRDAAPVGPDAAARLRARAARRGAVPGVDRDRQPSIPP